MGVPLSVILKRIFILTISRESVEVVDVALLVIVAGPFGWLCVTVVLVTVAIGRLVGVRCYATVIALIIVFAVRIGRLRDIQTLLGIGWVVVTQLNNSKIIEINT